MIKKSIILYMLLAILTTGLIAQTASTSDNLVAQPVPDRSVPFDVDATGISKSMEFGADLAWANEQNFRRVILFSGPGQVDIVRASFQPTYPLVNDTDLTQAQLDDLNYRLYLINTYMGPGTKLALNSDHPSVNSYYVGQPVRWAQLIQTTAQHFLNAGHNVVTVGAFNEPDYSATGQGTISDMYNINVEMSNRAFFNNIRLGGGNTLNCDQAQYWYDYLRPAGVDEGNTHQLAGSFDNFASFLINVRANGHHASLDEMHNVSEALVGYEYGAQTGIWWGPAEYARGEIAKATDGVRLGYAEHRPNWTAAAVYRTPAGKVQAFVGGSERQAATTTYNYISKDRVVYYDGHGPSHEFVLEIPGGAPGSYQNGQTNAEKVVNITWGEDIQQEVNGQYILVNRNSGLVLAVDGNAATAGTNVTQLSYTGASTQKWNIYPVDSRIGGDYSYYRLQPSSNTGMQLDLNNFSLDNGANFQQWTQGNGGNQQYYLDYAGDGWFYIRNRESSKCIDVFEASTANGANVVQWEQNGGLNQQWRLLPVGAPIEFTAPNAPTNLVATAQPASVKLTWTASSSADVAGYTILRAESASGPFNTIARKVTALAFVDNSTLDGVTYYYKVRAEDQSLNRSAYSNQVSAAATGASGLVASYGFENNTVDATVNLNNAALYAAATYATGKVGTKALTLSGSNFIQLPADIANHNQMTIATWVNWGGGNAWQRIFDFGNSQSENMFLAASNWAGELQFTVNNAGVSQNITAPGIPVGSWTHVAVTIGASSIKLYVNGVQAGQFTGSPISGNAFKPVQNYIGRSQYPDPALNASVDDFQVYNYVLSAAEIQNLAGTCAPSALVGYYNVNGTGWVIGTSITVNEGDLVVFGPQPVTGGAWSWTGCGTTGTAREQSVTMTSSCAATATHTNDCGGVSSITFNVTVIPAVTTTYYQLKNRRTGLFLDGMGRLVNGDNCGQYASTAHINSQWELIDIGGGYKQLKNRGTGMLLDGMGRTASGSIAGQWENTTGSYNAHWTVAVYSGSYYKVQNRATGLYLDGNSKTANGSDVYQYSSSTNTKQQWQLVQVPASGRVTDEPVSMPEAAEDIVLLYPNPVKNALNVLFADGATLKSIQIFDMSGKVFYQSEVSAVEMTIQLDTLPAGTYLIKIHHEHETFIHKFIKQ